MNTTSSRVSMVLEGLEKNLSKAREYLSMSEEEALGRTPRHPVELYDPSFTERFKSTLLRLQTARKFRRWELKNFNKSMVDVQIQHPTLTVKNETWARYLRNTGQYKGREDSESRRHTVKHGCQMLVLEDMMGTTGICAIIAFNHSNFRELRPREILEFKNALLQNPRYSEIVKLATEKTDWMQRCEELYDGNKASNQGEDGMVGTPSSEKIYPVESIANLPEPNGSTSTQRVDDMVDEDMYTSQFADFVEILGDIEEALGVAVDEWPHTAPGNYEEGEGSQAAWLLSELAQSYLENAADHADAYMTGGPDFFGLLYFDY